jgi:hypothetical protein
MDQAGRGRSAATDGLSMIEQPASEVLRYEHEKLQALQTQQSLQRPARDMYSFSVSCSGIGGRFPGFPFLHSGDTRPIMMLLM